MRPRGPNRLGRTRNGKFEAAATHARPRRPHPRIHARRRTRASTHAGASLSRSRRAVDLASLPGQRARAASHREKHRQIYSGRVVALRGAADWRPHLSVHSVAALLPTRIFRGRRRHDPAPIHDTLEVNKSHSILFLFFLFSAPGLLSRCRRFFSRALRFCCSARSS
jgi:hypothetical protein